MKLLAALAMLPCLAWADGTYTFSNIYFGDGVTTQLCETVHVTTHGCTTVAYAPSQLGLVNVSIRGRVGLGDDVVILGFIIPNGPARTVTILARGPSLAQHGIKDHLKDPRLTVVDQSGKIVDFNDNWGDPERRDSIIGSGHAPTDPREAASVLMLQPGAYTAIMGGGTGVGIVELFPR